MFFTIWDDLGSTPARVNRFTGEIQINGHVFFNYPDFYQEFFIEHEKGHFLTNTRSELKADRYAFQKLAGTKPRSLKQSVESLARVLSFRNPEHRERLIAMIIQALEYDYKHNGNLKAKEALEQINEISQSQKLNSYYMNTSGNSFYDAKYGTSEFGDIYDNAGGRARRQARRATRKTARVTKRTTRVEARQQRKQTRVAGRVARKQTRIANRAANPVYDAGNMMDPSYPVDNTAVEQSYPMNEQTSYPEPTDYTDAGGAIQEFPEEQEQEEFEEEEPLDSFFGEDGECIDLSYYGDEFDNGAGKARRQARRAKRQEQKEKNKDLKNDRLDAKNEIKRARADSKRTKADAKKSLADKGKSGTDWIGGAVDGVLGLFGKKKDSAEVAGDPSAMANDNSAGDGKLLGMPKSIAVAVIVILVMAILAAVITIAIKRSKKA